MCVAHAELQTELGEEQRANLSTLRLGHQTGRNQALRTEEGEGRREWGDGGLRGACASGGGGNKRDGARFLSCTSSPI